MESNSAANVNEFSFVDCALDVKIEGLEENERTEDLDQNSDMESIEPSEVVCVKMEPCESEEEQEQQLEENVEEDFNRTDESEPGIDLTLQFGSTKMDTYSSKCSSLPKTSLRTTDSEEFPSKSELRCKECNFLIATEEKLLQEQQTYYRHCGRKYYVCVVCFNAYSNRTHLTKHHERHHLKIRPYACELCNKEFSSVIEVSQHKNNIHLKLRQHECSICQKTFAQRPNLLTHQKTVHFKIKSFSCATCMKGFSRKSKLMLHIGQMHKAFSCDLCSKTYDQEDELSNHLSVVHSGIGEFICFACNKGFSKKNSLIVHQRVVHLRFKPHSCKLCGKSFDIKSHLGDHMAVHLRQRFTCELCTKSFSQNRTLKRHMKHNHPPLIHPGGSTVADLKEPQVVRLADSLSVNQSNSSTDVTNAE